MADEEPLEVVARVVGKARPVPPPRVVTGDLKGGQFDRRSTSVAFEAATVSDVSFAGIRFEELSVQGSCVFSGCDFSRARSRFMSYLSGALPQAVYRDCRFDRADLRDFRPEAARIERCMFDGARLDGWRSDLAEFVDCHFAGTVRNVKFWGRPHGLLAEEAGVDRPVNCGAGLRLGEPARGNAAAHEAGRGQACPAGGRSVPSPALTRPYGAEAGPGPERSP